MVVTEVVAIIEPKPFDLPGEAAEAARILDRLTTTLDRFAAGHNFASGLGLSAPQLGIRRAAAAIRAPHGERHVLLNPRIITRSGDTDEEYEGCLSCFDVRASSTEPTIATRRSTLAISNGSPPYR